MQELRVPAPSYAVLFISLVLPVFGQSTTPVAKHNMTPDDLAKMVRVAAPVLSPDGMLIAYTVSHVDVEADKSINELWMISWNGQNDVQLTYGPEAAGDPQWSPDGRYLSVHLIARGQGERIAGVGA